MTEYPKLVGDYLGKAIRYLELEEIPEGWDGIKIENIGIKKYIAKIDRGEKLLKNRWIPIEEQEDLLSNIEETEKNDEYEPIGSFQSEGSELQKTYIRKLSVLSLEKNSLLNNNIDYQPRSRRMSNLPGSTPKKAEIVEPKYVTIKENSVALPEVISLQTIHKNKKVSNSNFRPRKNPVMAKIEHPGVLEVDWKTYPVLPQLTQSSMEQILPKVESIQNQLKRAFVIHPETVVFDSFTPHKTFFKTLQVTNVSLVSHRFRVTFDPPNTYPDFFSLSSPDTPTGDKGLIAPGMSVKYKIFFTPNFSATTNVRLMVSSENGVSTFVDILASLEKPVLTIPNIIDVGFCTKDNSIAFQHEIKNTGGDGQFIFMSPNVPLGPFELFENAHCTEMVPQGLGFGRFKIFPSCFKLKKGESQILDIVYTPVELHAEHNPRRDSQKILLAFNNCTIFEFKIVGHVATPEVQIISTECAKDGLYFLGKSSIDKHVIEFGGENLGVAKYFNMTIKNPTELKLPFFWKNVTKEVVLDIDLRSEFQIIPSQGVFSAFEVIEFQISFTPGENGKVEQKMRLLQLDDAPLLDLSLIGTGVEYDVELSSLMICLPVDIYCGEKHRKMIKMENNSVSDVNFDWNVSADDLQTLNVNIDNGNVYYLESKACQLNMMVFSPIFPGKASGTISCAISSGLGPTIKVPLIGSSKLKPGEIYFKASNINLGLVKLEGIRRMMVPFVNKSELTMHFDLKLLEKDINNSSYLFVIEPNTGTLKPREQVQILITYIPLWYHQLRSAIQVFAGISDTSEKILVSAIEVRADALTPHLSIENSINSFSTFKNVICKFNLLVRNIRSIPANFEWRDVKNENYEVKFKILKGIVQPFETTSVPIEIQTFKEGDSDIKINGLVEGMVEHGSLLSFQILVYTSKSIFMYQVVENQIAWDMRAIMKPSKPLNPNSDANLRLDFGLTCPVFESRKRTLIIRNHTSSKAEFDLTVQNFLPTLIEQVTAETESHNEKRNARLI
jgi:hypothetical protein